MVWIVERRSCVCVVDMVETPSSHRHHCTEHPSDSVYTSNAELCRDFENWLEFPSKYKKEASTNLFWVDPLALLHGDTLCVGVQRLHVNMCGILSEK